MLSRVVYTNIVLREHGVEYCLEKRDDVMRDIVIHFMLTWYKLSCMTGQI